MPVASRSGSAHTSRWSGPTALLPRFVRLAAVGAGLAVPEEGDPFEDIEDAEIVEDGSEA